MNRFITLIAIPASAAVSHGALLVHDPFDYSNDDTTLNGQSSAARTGFANGDAWVVEAPTATTVNFHSTATSLSYSSLQTSGGKGLTFRNSGGTGSSKTNSLDSSTDFVSYTGTELWWSILVNADGYNPTGAEYFEFNWDHQAVGGERIFGFRLEGSKTILARHHNNGFLSNTGATLTTGDNLLLFRMTNDTGSSGNDELEMWLNPNLSSVGSADFSREGSFIGLVQGNSSYGFDGIQVLYDYNSDDSVLIDEFRMGDTMADVIPVVPEPSSAILVLAGLSSGLLRRRRSQ